MSHDRYGFAPAHEHYGGGREFEPAPRGQESWQGPDAHYGPPNTREDWSRAEIDYSPYQHPPPQSYDKRPLSYEPPWPPMEDPRAHSHAALPPQNDRYHEHNMPSRWHNNHREDEQVRRHDFGWEPRHSDSGWGRPRHTDTANNGHGHASQQDYVSEDRMWEPAAAWKSNHGQPQEQRDYRGPNRAQNGRKSGKKQNNNQNRGRQKREWKSEDSNLNK